MAKKDKGKKHKKQEEAIGTPDFGDAVKRLNRINGQVEGICKMLKNGRKLHEVLMQCKAIHSALRSIEMQVVHAHLDAALDEVAHMDKRKNRAERLAELEELFKQAA